MIERTDEPSRRVRGVGAGPFLLAVSAARSGARRSGAVARRHPASPSSPVPSTPLYFRDPEGNRVAVSSYPLHEVNNEHHYGN